MFAEKNRRKTRVEEYGGVCNDKFNMETLCEDPDAKCERNVKNIKT